MSFDYIENEIQVETVHVIYSICVSFMIFDKSNSNPNHNPNSNFNPNPNPSPTLTLALAQTPTTPNHQLVEEEVHAMDQHDTHRRVSELYK